MQHDNNQPPKNPALSIDEELLRFLVELGIDARTDEYLRQLARLAAHAASVDDIARQLKARSDTLDQREQQLHQALTQHEQNIAAQVETVNEIAQKIAERMEQIEQFNQYPMINGRYRDLGDGTVLDIKTNLQWMRCALGQIWDGKICVGEAAKFNWDDAHATAEKVHFAGFNDWRLPTKDELLTLVIEGNRPAIDQQAFPNRPSSWFWSGSPDANDSGSAWYVNFNNGGAYSNYRNDSNHVRPVRGGQ